MSALWTSDEVARALAPATISAPFEANGVTFDSRAVAKGDLFFALSGETTDGHGFVGEALKRGAAAAVISRDVETAGGTLIRVPDTMKALVEPRPRRPSPQQGPDRQRHRLGRQDQHQGRAAGHALGPGADLGQRGELQQPCRRADKPRPPAARGALRRLRDRHESSRRDRAAGPPGRGACRRDHQCRAGPYRLHGLGGGHRRREGLPVRRHGGRCSGRAQPRQSLTTIAWRDMPAASACRASLASAEARPPRRGFSPAACRIRAATLSP